MKRVFSLLSVIAFALVLALLLILYSPRDVKASKVTITSGGRPTDIDAEVADNHLERTIGLMNRESLGENSGMVFIFQDEKMRSFWMKNTLIPLDMIFVSEGLDIVHIGHNVQPCGTDQCGHYSSVKPAKYVIEVNGGFAQKHGINVGDSVFIALGY